jgi:uncharacterized protein YjbI with pentapeptide repeats
MEPKLKTRLLHYLQTTVVVLLFTAALTGVVIQGYSASWTGFGRPAGDLPQAKTLWNWMELLLFPLLFGSGFFLVYRLQRDTARWRAALDLEIATGSQQESALQAYVDRISELLIKEKLSRFSTDEIRNVARLRTLTLLRGLDPKRKSRALLFLKESALIEREAVIDLCGADLRGVSVPSTHLSRVNLGEANLNEADLRSTQLKKAYLSGTQLRGADLRGADLSGADLFGADLSGADLTRATLSGANLTGANLSGCRLDGADLSKADLSGVHLRVNAAPGNEIARTELKKARSLDGAILPDGTIHE